MPQTREARSLPGFSPLDPHHHAWVLAVAATHDIPPAFVSFEAGAEAADVREITFQVRDRAQAPWAKRWRLLVFLAATVDGDPSPTGNTVVWTTGTVLETLTANALYEVLTDANGVAVATVEISGAATRYVYAHALPQLEHSDAIEWV